METKYSKKEFEIFKREIKMEAKQFPEKWAVRGSREFAEFLKRCDKINNSKVLDGDVEINLYFIRGDTLCFDDSNNIHDGYTEVTIEDLIAHYEPKKMVRCVDASECDGLSIGKEYLIIREEGVHAWVINNDGREETYNRLRFEEIPTHPKWRPLTSKGNRIEEIIDYHTYIIVKLKGVDVPIIFNSKGSSFYVDYGNLIPYNPRISELENIITSKRSELADLESELNTLKGK